MTNRDEDKIVWRCSNKKCNATVSTNISTSKITYTRHIHPSHGPKPDEYFLKLHTRQGIKRRAVDQPDQRPLKMICLEIKSVDASDSIREQDFQNFQKSVHRTRHQKRGRNLPKNIDEVIAALEEEMLTQSAEGAHMIKQVEKEVVMLATDRSLELLKDSSLQVFGDGTFRYSPRFFTQLYTFHVFKDGFYVPVAYFLLINKRQKTYERMFDCLKLHGGPGLKICVMTVDFEETVMKETKKAFPDAIIRGCRFHLAQSWQRMIGEKGFKKQYISKKDPIAKFLRSLFGIPLMPADAIPNFFSEELLPIAPPELGTFMTYLQDFYMLENSTFPPHIWASVGHSDMKFTTNGCENFHRHLRSFFTSHKPDIYTFLENLDLIEIRSKIKAQSQRPTPDDGHTRQLWGEVTKKNMTPLEFMIFVSKSNQPISKGKRQKKSDARRSARVAKQIRLRYTKRVLAVLTK